MQSYPQLASFDTRAGLRSSGLSDYQHYTRPLFVFLTPSWYSAAGTPVLIVLRSIGKPIEMRYGMRSKGAPI